MNLQIKIIGLGGIGSILSEKLCQFLHYYQGGLAENENFSNEMGVEAQKFDDVTITLVDGDHYEARNRERQDFSHIGPKAFIKEEDLRNNYRRLSFESIGEYVNSQNISEIIKEDDVVLVCVDNHKSRKLVNDYCSTLQNIYVFSGGNKFHTASTQRYIKKNGVDIRPNLTKFHPEIERANGNHPEGLGCEELAESAPQLLFANWAAALSMALSFYTEIILRKDTGISDSYIDLISGNMLSKKYKP